jgi:ribosomal protein L14E/L6E/L27E
MESQMGPSGGYAEVQGEGDMGPSGASANVHGEGEGFDLSSRKAAAGFPAVTIHEVLSEPADLPCPNTQYLVDLGESEAEDEFQLLSSQDVPSSQEQPGSPRCHEQISGVLTLPTIPIRRCRVTSIEPMVDYSKSILLTSDAYLTQMQHLASKRNEAAKSRDARKLATEEKKRKCKEERIQQVKKKKERDEVKAHKARETAYWVEVATRGWGNELQSRMKSSLPPPPGSYTGVYVGSVPQWCIANQRRRRVMLDLKRAGASYEGGRAAATASLSEHG